MLVEHPAAWGPKAFPDERLPASIQRALRQKVRSYPNGRPLLIRQQHPQRSRPELQGFLVHSREQNPQTFRLRGNSYEELLRCEPEPWTQPLYLVCTHGTHDKCCAKFGFATYCATRELASESVWECSHVGGDRFAGNVICLPHGIYYGNVFAEDTPDIVEAYGRKQLSLKHYRGRSCYPRLAQVGEYFIRSEAGIPGIEDLELLEASELESGFAQVRFNGAGTDRIFEVEFRLSTGSFPQFVTCAALKPQTVSQFELTNYRQCRR